MEIIHAESGHKGVFYVEADGLRLAEMTYTRAGEDTIIIEHTEVADSLRGTGAGLKLVLAGVDYARKNHLKIVPLCPFARSVFNKREDLHDVLK